MSLDSVVGVLLDALSFVLVLGVAVLIHEAGHFFVAIWSGVKVEKFSIGFGRPIVRFHHKDVEYIIAWIPMGGYVKMAGENPAETTGAENEFYSISPWKRIPIVIAGPAFNILGAFVIFFGLAFLYGSEYNYNVIGSVIPGSVGDKAGLKPGDVLRSADGVPMTTWEEFEDHLQRARFLEKDQVALAVNRGASEETIHLDVSEEAQNRVFVLSVVDPVGPAFETGLRDFDRIVAIDGKSAETWPEFTRTVRSLWTEEAGKPVGKTVAIAWESAGEIRSASITPAIVKDETGTVIAQIGVGSAGLGIAPQVPPIVGAVVRGLPAREAGIEPGAKIVAINGELVSDRDRIQRIITYSYEFDPDNPKVPPKGVPLEVSWMNPGSDQIFTKTIVPKVEMTPLPSSIGLRTAKEIPIARLGIAFAEPTRSLGLVGSLQSGVDGVVHAVEQTFFVLNGLITGSVHHKLVGGPVAILQISAKVGREGLKRLFWFCAFLQVNLAILNLLPIPILDGGHLVVSLVEGISRRTFSLRQREIIQYIGLAFLLPLFLFVFINDFARIGLFSWIAGLFT